jgi:nicotinate-nucleotide pyrophosphorylase (carboxylating)
MLSPKKTEAESWSSLYPGIQNAIRNALEEDIGTGDVTTLSIVSPESRSRAEIIAKQEGTIAGLDVAAAVFSFLDGNIVFEPVAAEGARVNHGDVVAKLSGPTGAILTGERTALNFLGRMSGIATMTRQFVDAVAGTPAKILDTRKTAPGLRSTDKVAVKRGGGYNHRYGLYDMILIKDNHIASVDSLADAVKRARASAGNLDIEVEAATLDDVKAAIEQNVNRILLDNMSYETLAQAVALTAGRAELEASGNVNLNTVRKIAETGVDYISVGALTHSAKVFDFSLQFKDKATERNR